MLKILSTFSDEYTQRGYSLSTRIGYSQLVKKFASRIKEAEDSFTDEIKKATENFIRNMTECKRMDQIMRDSFNEQNISKDDTHEAPIILRQKDGTKKLGCLFHNCEVKTFRLRRHLKTIHSELTQEEMDYLVKMSLAMASNATSTAQDCSITPIEIEDSVTDIRGDKKTNLVSRRYNWKKCVLCKTLQSNMTTHLKSTHKICKNDNTTDYNSYIKNSEVVPRCYIKKN